MKLLAEINNCVGSRKCLSFFATGFWVAAIKLLADLICKYATASSNLEFYFFGPENFYHDLLLLSIEATNYRISVLP